MRILSLPAITTAITPAAVSAVYQSRGAPIDMTLQATFNFGSGVGTTCDCFVQTSVDNLQWCDIANFHFDTSSARNLFNLSSNTSVTNQATPTDGTLTANTCTDGLLGHWFRCKYSSSGLYAGGTSLMIDAVSSSRLEKW